ncbi:zinc transporter ZIP1-like isoform X2 [Antennarius striatus]|uniref:zinc transporter ZIP1-like isoform X2 n=1 Tax=Antennarius striatus TaxID=241820 RepID=UPI0035AF982B
MGGSPPLFFFLLGGRRLHCRSTPPTSPPWRSNWQRWSSCRASCCCWDWPPYAWSGWWGHPAWTQLHFPLPEFILAMGFFLVLVLEQMVLTFRDQSASPVEERRSLLLDSTIQEVDRIAQRPSRRRRCPDDSDGVRSQLALRAFILVFSLSLHSVFQGLAVGLLQDGAQVLEMCPALMIHKSMVSFSLVFTLCRDQLRRPVVAGCLLLFAAMSPLGLGVGVALSEAGAPPQHQLARSTLEGLATGAFIYVTFMEILPQELSSSRNRILKVAMLLLGFAVVTAVLFLRM